MMLRTVAVAIAALLAAGPAGAQTIASAELEIQGSGLRVVESAVTTGVDIPTSVQTEFGGKRNEDAPFVERLLAQGELTGPGLDVPLTLTAEPGHAFRIPGLRAEGLYLLQNIRLVKDGTFVQSGVPSVATITVADVLQTSVHVRQLTAEELRARGIQLDPRFYDVYEYTFSFLVDGELVEIPFPVAIDPRTREATPIDQENGYRLPLDRQDDPPRWTPPQTTPFEFVGEEEMPLPSPVLGEEPAPRPRIPAALVIPNDIAVLHQFFSVALMVTNGAPDGSAITLDSVRATIELPPELRVEEISPSVSFGSPVPIVDAENGVTFLVAQASGEADWVLEGLRPGTHTIEFDLRATYRAPGQPDLPMRAAPRASVVVHDPRFNITFSHPDSVRAGNPYATYSFVSNLSPAAQSIRIANGLPSCIENPSANVCRDSSTPEVHELTLAAGEMLPIEYRLVSNVTGRVFATAGTVEGDALSAAVQLHMGVSESGIPLSPATLVLPYYAQFLDPVLLSDHLQLLGLGYSIATAPLNQTTAKFPRVIRTDVFSRAVDLARAGQHLFIGATEHEILPGLALDALGNVTPLAEWDELRRLERAGRVASASLARRLEVSAPAGATHASLLDSIAERNAHRAPFLAAAVSGAPTGTARPYALSVRGTSSNRRLDVPSEATEAWVRQLAWAESNRLDLGGAAGEIALIGRWSEDLEIAVTPAEAGAFQVHLVWPASAPGTVLRASLDVTGSEGETLTIALTPGNAEVRAVTPAGAIAALATATTVAAPPLAVVAARQDLHLDEAGRKVSVLFNRPIATDPDLRARFRAGILFDRDGVQWDGPRPISSAALQHDARVVNLGFDHVLSTNASYSITIDPIDDPLTGQPASIAGPIVPRIDNDLPAGIVYGRVLRADDTPVGGAAVSLSIYSARSRPYPESTQIEDSREDGSFLFESVARDPERGYDGAYALRAVDAAGKETSLSGTVRLPGRVQFVTLVYLGRGTAEGVVRYEDGTRVAGANVVVGSTMFNQSRQTGTDASGFYRVDDLPVGPLTISVVDDRGNVVYAAIELNVPGEIVTRDLTIHRRADPGSGTVRGVVLRSDSGEPVAGARVGAFSEGYAIGETYTAADGRFSFERVPTGFVTVLAADWSVSRTSAAIDFDLAADAVREVTLALQVVPEDQLVRIEGTVLSEDPLHPGDPDHYQPAAGALVRVDGVATVTADSNGRFAFEAVPQSFSGREIRGWDPASSRSAATTLPALQSGTNLVALLIGATGGTGTIRVRLVDAHGFPVDGYRLLIPGIPATLLEGKGGGTYELKNVRVGAAETIWAVPGAENSGYGHQWTRGTARVDFAGYVAGLTLRLPGEGRVRVRLRSDIDVIGDVTMSHGVWDDGEQRIVPHETTLSTSEDGVAGYATFAGVPALQPFSVSSVHPVHGHAAASGQLAFGGDLQTITLQLDRLASVRGVVYEIDGRTPVAGASVRLFDGRQDQGVQLTASDGSFEFRNVATSSPFDVIATLTRDGIYRTGFASAITPVDGGAVENVSVMLRRRGLVEGKVVYAAYKVFDPLNPINNIADDTPEDPSDNAPVPLAKLRVRELGFPARSFGSETDPLSADVEGRFELGNVFEGSLRASAWDPGNQEIRGDWSGELINEGERVLAIVAIGGEGVGALEAEVLDPNEANAPVVNAEVVLLRFASGGWSAFDLGATDGAGRARFEQLPAGDYLVQAYSKALGRSGSSPIVAVLAEQTARAGILLELSGRVLGEVVDPMAGGAGVAGAHVTLRALGWDARATSDPLGTFLFEGVREGAFELTAREPDSNRFARSSGALSQADPEPFITLELEPTETLHLQVALPADDGSDSGVPAPFIAVDLAQRCVTVESKPRCDVVRAVQGENPVVIEDLLRNERYDLSIREIGGEMRTLRFSGEFPGGSAPSPLRLVLPAFGSVRVSVAQGGVPASGARVRASGGGRSFEAFTDGAGVALLTGLLLGTVSVQATSLDGAFSDSGNVVLSSHSTPADLALQLGSYAGIAGFVESETGGASIGTRVVATFSGRTLEILTDAEGRFRFQGVPTSQNGTPVTLTYIGPDELTVGAQQTIVVPGSAASSVVEVPPVKLDATPPRILSLTPPDGGTEISPDSAVIVAFSEPIRADQLHTGLFLLIPADASTSLPITFSTSTTADGTFLVSMTPPPPPPGQPFPLASNTLYRVVVSADVQDATGNRLGVPRGASFITSDYAEPRVIRTEPSTALPLQASAAIRFVFNEPIDQAAFTSGGSTLLVSKLSSAGGSVVARKAGSTLFDPAAPAAVTFAPGQPFEEASFYRAVIHGARDLQGNVAADQVFEFFTFDETPPHVTLVSPVPAGQTLVSGVEYTILPEIRNASAGGTPAIDVEKVDWSRVAGAADTFVYRATAAPWAYRFVAPEAPPEGTSITIRAVAHDLSLNASGPADLTLEVRPNQTPADLALVLDPESFYPASAIEAVASFSDEGLVATVEVELLGVQESGAAYRAIQMREVRRKSVADPWPQARMPFELPVTLEGGSTLRVALRVTDVRGLQASISIESIVLADAAAPAVAILDPAEGQIFLEKSGNTIPIRTTAVDGEVRVETVIARVDDGAGVELARAGEEWVGSIPVPPVAGSGLIARTLVVTATDPALNAGTASVGILIEPLYDPNAPVVSWACPSPGGLLPVDSLVKLRIRALGNDTGNASNGVDRVEFFVDGATTPLAGSAVSGVADHYEALFATPSDTAEGETIRVRAVVTNVAGSSNEASTDFQLVSGLEIASSLTIDETNAATYEGKTLIVTGGITTVVGPRSFDRLMVLEGASVTHGATDAATIHRLDLSANQIYIGCGGSIDASGLGFSGASGGSGRTWPNTYDGGSFASAGGSHGGLGGTADPSHRPATTYGSVFDPATPGSAGGHGNSSCTGCNPGGGIVRLQAVGAVVIDGAVLSDGRWTGAGSSGAGGSILIRASSLNGSGTIRAEGAALTHGNGSGGGGRIALYFDEADFARLRISAAGGTSTGTSTTGAAGTIFLKDGARPFGDLVVDNFERERMQATVLPGVGYATALEVGSGVIRSDGPFGAPDHLRGMFLFRHPETAIRWPIVGNNEMEIQVDGSQSPLAGSAGDTFRGVYRFGSIRLRNAALASVDLIEADEIASDAALSLHPPNESPPTVDPARIHLEETDLGQSVRGSAGSIVDPDLPVTAVARNDATGEEFAVAALPDGSFAVVIRGAPGETISLRARDGHRFPWDSARFEIGTLATAAHEVESIPISADIAGGDSNFRARRIEMGAPHLLVWTGEPLANESPSDKIVVFDASTPSAPVHRQTLALGRGAIRDLEVRGPWGFAASQGGLTVLDLGAAPILSYGTSAGCGADFAIVAGAFYAFVANSCGDGRIEVWDIVDPSAPRFVREQGIGAFGTWRDLESFGDFLVGITPDANGTADAVVIDRRDVHNLRLVTAVDVPQFTAVRGRKVGTRLLVTDRNGKWAALDLSDPLAPVIESVTETSAYSRGVDANGFAVAIAEGTSTASLWRREPPALPRLEGSILAGGTAWDVAFGAAAVYVANDIGLAVAPVGSPPQITDALIRVEGGEVARVIGSVGAVSGEAPLTVTVQNVESGAELSAATMDGSFVVELPGEPGDRFAVRARDASGRTAGPVEIGRMPFGTGMTTLPISGAMAGGDAGFRARRLAGEADHLLVWMGDPLSGEPVSDKLVVFDAAVASAPMHRETLDLDREVIRDVEVRGGMAYIAAHRGLVALELEVSPIASYAISSGCGADYALGADESHLFVANSCQDGRIEIWDITNPRTPRFVREQGMGAFGVYRTLEVFSDAWLVGIGPGPNENGTTDLVVMDRRDVRNLKHAATFDVPGFVATGGHKFADDLLYLTDRDGKWAAVDMSDPAAPVLRSVTQTSGGSAGISGIGGGAVVANRTTTVGFWDETDPAFPILLGEHEIGGATWDARHHAGALWVATDVGLAIVNGVPAPPQLARARISPRRDAGGARVGGSAGAALGSSALVVTALVRSGGSGSAAVDATGGFDVAVPAVAGETIALTATDEEGRSSTLELSVPFAASIEMLPATPTEASDDGNYLARRLAVANGRAVVTTGSPAAAFVTLSDKALLFTLPSASATASVLSVPTGAGGHHSAALMDEWAYAVGDRLAAWSVTDLSPQPMLGDSDPPGIERAIAVVPMYAFTSEGSQFRDGRIFTWSLANPGRPVLVGTSALAGVVGVEYHALITAEPNLLFAISPDRPGGVGRDVTVVDRSDPAALSKLAELDVPNFDAIDGALWGTTLYLAGLDGGIAIVDVSNPSSPQHLATIDTPGIARAVAALSADEIVVADGTIGITFINVADRTSPILLGTQPLAGNATDVRLLGTEILVATDHHVQIVRRE